MAEEKVLKFRRAAEYLHSKNEELQNTMLAPFIIAMKGDPATGRKLAAFIAASILRCPLIKEHDFDNYDEKTEENQARIGRKICQLASSQLKSGRSVVIDTELANKNAFDQLKELSEINKTPLSVFECQVDNAGYIWESRNGAGDERNSTEHIASEFLEKPSSRYINPTNYKMGEILKIPLEIDNTWTIKGVVPYALKDLRDHIDPNFQSEETNNCNHIFVFNKDDEYQRRCWKCRQLVSGSFYRCRYCRLIVHRTCCYFPKSFTVHNVSPMVVIEHVTFNLRHVVPELDAEATCSCCKKLLTGRYYSTKDGHVLFDLDCLLSLPAKRRTKFHEHELLRAIGRIKRRCGGCDAIIDKNTIFYYCKREHELLSFDVYCLWLPETVDFERHRHPFKLSVVPRVDSLPYYCEVCQDERNTECWIYYCAECDYPIHPRCLVEAPSLLRSLSTQISKEKPTGPKCQGCTSHLSSEGVMVKELPREHRSEAKELRLLFNESLKDIELPILIMTKGHSDTGRKLVASILATTLDSLLIDKDNLCEVTNIANEPEQINYQEFLRIALSQLQIGLSVVIDSDLSHKPEFFFLRDFAIATERPLFIVECKQCDEDILGDFHKIRNLSLDSEYDVCDTPKLIVNVTTPTFDGIKGLMPHILHSISSYSKQWRKRNSKETETPYCYTHSIPLGFEHDVSEGEICIRCSKKLSTPILRCEHCDLVLHRDCTDLPLRIDTALWTFILVTYADNNDKFRCNVCNNFVGDNAYTSSGTSFNCLICLDCWFTPPKPTANLHEHPLKLSLFNDHFQCKACDSYCNQNLHYMCTHKGCYFRIGVKCGMLKETVPFDRHRHPFDLIVSPEHVSNQYYCEVCGEERNKNHWVYCCVECDYFIHIRCLVPTGGCPPSES